MLRRFGLATALAGALLHGVALAAHPTGPKPLASPGTWISDDDYPPEPLRNNIMGVVRFTLIIDPAGAVSGCEIGQSSGDADLDRATCDLLTERGKFSPATDAQGHATTGRYTSSVRWQIPGSDGIHPPSPQPSALTLSFDVETDGRMTGCRIEHAEGEAAYFKAENLPCNQDKVVSPYLGPDGKPVKRHVVVISQVRVEPVDPAKP